MNLCELIQGDYTRHDEGVLWCRLDNILIGVIYIPPAGSVNFDDDIFERIQQHLSNIKTDYNISSVCIMGDFNGRTGTEADFVSFDKHIIDTIDDHVCDDILGRI